MTLVPGKPDPCPPLPVDFRFACLYRIRRLREIEVLDLMTTDVSDAGLQHLRRMTRLRRLDVYGTRVTAGGIAGLRKSLPDMGVNFRGSTPAE